MYRMGVLKHCIASGVVLCGLGLLPAVAQSGGSSAPGPGGSSPASTGSGTNAAANKSGMSAMDQHFMKEAAEGGLAEVELGNLAAQKASGGEVKKFGERMVQDHTKANDQLKQIASNKGVKLPSEPSHAQMAEKKRLEKLSGTQFDQAYMNAMLKDHKKDVADFQKESQSGKDPDLKNFASQTLPSLQDHLKQEQRVAPGANRTSMQKPSAAIARK
jgi:putative membrane protein